MHAVCLGPVRGKIVGLWGNRWFVDQKTVDSMNGAYREDRAGKVWCGHDSRLVGEKQSVGRRMTVAWWVENSISNRERERERETGRKH